MLSFNNYVILNLVIIGNINFLEWIIDIYIFFFKSKKIFFYNKLKKFKTQKKQKITENI